MFKLGRPGARLSLSDRLREAYGGTPIKFKVLPVPGTAGSPEARAERAPTADPAGGGALGRRCREAITGRTRPFPGNNKCMK